MKLTSYCNWYLWILDWGQFTPCLSQIYKDNPKNVSSGHCFGSILIIILPQTSQYFRQAVIFCLLLIIFYHDHRRLNISCCTVSRLHTCAVSDLPVSPSPHYCPHTLASIPSDNSLCSCSCSTF